MALLNEFHPSFAAQAQSAVSDETEYFYDGEPTEIVDLPTGLRYKKLCNFIVLQTIVSFKNIMNQSMHPTIIGHINWLEEDSETSELSPTQVFSSADYGTKEFFVQEMTNYLKNKLEKSRKKIDSVNAKICADFIEECIERLEKI